MLFMKKLIKEYTYNMGAINSAFNQGLGAVATAIAVGKKMSNEQAKNTEEGLLAKEHYHEASAELTELEGRSAEAGEALNTATQKVEATKSWNMTGKNKKMLEGKVAKRLSEQEAAQRAFDELQDRIEAKVAMKSRAEKIMKRTGT